MNFNQFKFSHDRFSFNPHTKAQLRGVRKAKPTGNLLGDTKQYVGVIVEGFELPARPCFNFGSFAFLPTQEWLDKYKNEVFFWVLFEGGNIRSCVFIGWCFNNGKEPSIAGENSSWPDKAFFRSVHFTEIFDDKEKMHILEFEKDYIKFGTKGFIAKVAEWYSEVKNKWHTKSKYFNVTADSVKIGSEGASEPAVLGSELNKNIVEALSEVRTMCDTIGLQATNLAAAASSNPATQAMAPSFSLITTGLRVSSTKISVIITKLASHLSKKIKIE